MMYIKLHNDGTGSDMEGNYDVEVLINSICVWRGRVEGHNRASGWRQLVEDLSDVLRVAPPYEVWRYEYDVKDCRMDP